MHFRVKFNAQARFCLPFGMQSKWDNFLHTPPQPSLRSKLSNKSSCKSFGFHLIGQPEQNLKLHISSFNPALGRRWVCLNDLLNSNFCETLGHEITPKYLSNHAPKVEGKDPICFFYLVFKEDKPFYPVPCFGQLPPLFLVNNLCNLLICGLI